MTLATNLLSSETVAVFDLGRERVSCIGCPVVFDFFLAQVFFVGFFENSTRLNRTFSSNGNIRSLKDLIVRGKISSDFIPDALDFMTANLLSWETVTFLNSVSSQFRSPVLCCFVSHYYAFCNFFESFGSGVWETTIKGKYLQPSRIEVLLTPLVLSLCRSFFVELVCEIYFSGFHVNTLVWELPIGW